MLASPITMEKLVSIDLQQQEKTSRILSFMHQIIFSALTCQRTPSVAHSRCLWPGLSCPWLMALSAVKRPPRSQSRSEVKDSSFHRGNLIAMASNLLGMVSNPIAGEKKAVRRSLNPHPFQNYKHDPHIFTVSVVWLLL